MSALDKEASNLQTQSELRPSTPRRIESRFFDGNTESEADEEAPLTGERPKSAMSGLSKSKSENDFEKIDAESGTEEVENTRRQGVKRDVSIGGGGSWMPWSWGAKNEVVSEESDVVMGETEKEREKAFSSGIEL